MVRKILIWPNTHLFDKSKAIDFADVNTEAFKELVTDLKETLDHYRGVGLSAVQVGVPLRVFVMETKSGIETFVNPYVMSFEAPFKKMKEGCLSIPGVEEEVERSPEVIVAATNLEDGSERLWSLADVEAQCAQHEIEHFEGKTMMDRYGVAKRQVLKRTISKTVLYDPRYQL